jgi:hypothetical protein
MGDFSEATQLLNDIPGKYRMSPEEYTEFQDFDTYARLLIEFRANGRHLKDLSPQDEQILASIAANGNKIGNIRAKNWIQLNGAVLDWYEPVSFPSSQLAKKANKKKGAKPTLISIQPNPTNAANGFWLQSNNGEALSGQLTIIDAAGKEIVNIKIDNQQVKLIPTESLQKGVYILRWIDKMNGLQSEKLIVQ